MYCSQCTEIPLVCVFHSSAFFCLTHYKDMLYIQRLLKFCLEFFLIFVVAFFGLGVAITSVYASRLLKREWRVRARMLCKESLCITILKLTKQFSLILISSTKSSSSLIILSISLSFFRLFNSSCLFF